MLFLKEKRAPEKSISSSQLFSSQRSSFRGMFENRSAVSGQHSENAVAKFSDRQQIQPQSAVNSAAAIPTTAEVSSSSLMPYGENGRTFKIVVFSTLKFYSI